ncbi:MAG: GlxA family transcriptional regulator [Pseudomonadota bacterium]
MTPTRPAAQGTAPSASQTDDGPAPAAERSFGFVIVDEFSMIALTAAVEPLRSANRIVGREAYRWRLISADGGPVTASSGLTVATDMGLESLAESLARPATIGNGAADDMGIDVLLVVTGLYSGAPNEARLHALLRRAARAGLVIGSLSAGAFVLARAGLLEGHRCTVHWEYQPAFEEAFPEVECSSGLYVIDGLRWTGSGGISSMDMMLHIIGVDHGPRVAREVGNNFQVDRIRNAAIEQRPGALERLETLPDPLQRVIALMRANIEAPLRMSEIAAHSTLNLRRMERLFQSHLGQSPAQFYRALRLERARELLMHTNLSALEAAMLTGFSSSSHFAMAYYRQHGIRPSETRRSVSGSGSGSGSGGAPAAPGPSAVSPAD